MAPSPLDMNSLRSYNRPPFFNFVDSGGSVYNDQRNDDSPTESFSSTSTAVSPSNENYNYSNSLEYCVCQKDFQFEPVGDTLQPQGGLASEALAEAMTPYMTSPTEEISPTGNPLQTSEVHQLSSAEPTSMPFEDMPLAPKHELIVLEDADRTWLYNKFVKIVGDHNTSFYQCQIDKCSTRGYLYTTVKDIGDHVENEILTRRFACRCKTTFKNLADCRRHVKDKNQPHQFPCPACPRRFGRADALKAHCVPVHGFEPGNVI